MEDVTFWPWQARLGCPASSLISGSSRHERGTVEVMEMPISPEKMVRYPGGSIRSPEWLEFRASILERAGNRCEGTPMHPDCRIPNGAMSARGTKVVLTIAHMDHDATHADPERCRALCQRCHLNWDRKNHIANAAENRRRKAAQRDFFCASPPPGKDGQ